MDKIQLRFIGIAGSSYTGDIAIDDISATYGQCGTLIFRFNACKRISMCTLHITI